MKSAIALIFAFLLTIIAFAVVAENIRHLTIPILGFAGGSLVLALGLAIPASLKDALVIIVPYLPDALVGGRRKTDPPKQDGQ